MDKLFSVQVLSYNLLNNLINCTNENSKTKKKYSHSENKKKRFFLAVFVTNSRNDIQQYVALKDNTLFCKKKKKNEYIYHFCSKKNILKVLMKVNCN